MSYLDAFEDPGMGVRRDILLNTVERILQTHTEPSEEVSTEEAPEPQASIERVSPLDQMSSNAETNTTSTSDNQETSLELDFTSTVPNTRLVQVLQSTEMQNRMNEIREQVENLHNAVEPVTAEAPTPDPTASVYNETDDTLEKLINTLVDSHVLSDREKVSLLTKTLTTCKLYLKERYGIYL